MNYISKLKYPALFFLIIFLLRAFVYEPFKIPSMSMMPTLMVGDHIWVQKYAYGLKLPMTRQWLFRWAEPHRGEVVVFVHPEDEQMDYIKRVVGLPGDKIQIKEGGTLSINGVNVVEKDFVIEGKDPEDFCIAALSQSEQKKSLIIFRNSEMQM